MTNDLLPSVRHDFEQSKRQMHGLMIFDKNRELLPAIDLSQLHGI
jgi:hypothetical protein